MKQKAVNTLTTVLSLCVPVFMIMFINCASSVDTGRDFAMVLNGRPYKVKLAKKEADMRRFHSYGPPGIEEHLSRVGEKPWKIMRNPSSEINLPQIELY